MPQIEEADVYRRCPHCTRPIRDKGNFYKHLKLCKQKHQNMSEEERIAHLVEIEVEKRMREVEARMQQQQQRPLNIVNNGPVYNGPVYNQSIVLKPFGQENTSYITEEQKTDCLLRLKTGFLSLVKMIHFDEDNAPENRNVRVKSSKQQIIEVFDGKEWVQHDASWVLDNILAHGYKILSRHFIENCTKDFMKDRQEYIHKFITDISDSQEPRSKMYYGIRREIWIMIKQDTDSMQSSGTLYLMARPDDA